MAAVVTDTRVEIGSCKTATQQNSGVEPHLLPPHASVLITSLGAILPIVYRHEQPIGQGDRRS